MRIDAESVRRANRVIAVMVCALLLVGVWRSTSLEQGFAYLLVVVAAVMPGVLWIRMGAVGVPILPVVAIAYIPYFAWPLLGAGANTEGYTVGEIARAGFTVALFLGSATVAWRLIAAPAQARSALIPDQADPARVIRFVLVGLAVGTVFHVSLVLNLFGDLGSLYGLVRSIAVTFVTVACFLVGVTRAQGLLRGTSWAIALACMAAITLMSWSTLFLVGGMLYLVSAGLGYVLVAKRVPLLAFGAVFAVIAILHAGKGEMRDRYWTDGANVSENLSAIQLPGLLADWFVEGIYQIGTAEVGATLVERASLIQMLLLAQSDTPDRVDYLRGETYALLPEMLVPRFIDSNKPASQVGMDLLNIRYGILTSEGASATAVGWGLVAEAYANFGYFGVVAAALALGGICGALARWGVNREITSIPTLAAISVMLSFVNLEADSIQLFASTLQSIAAVVIFSVLYRWFSVSRGGTGDQDAEASAGTEGSEAFRRRS